MYENDYFVSDCKSEPAGGNLPATGNLEACYNAYFATHSGNVGIGTTTPPAHLTINGGKTNSSGITVKSGDVDLVLTEDDASNGGKIQVFKYGSSSTIGNATYSLLLQPEGGSVGIGTTSPDGSYILDVRGSAHFCKAIVKTPGWCDFVFDNNYHLMPLNELKSYILTNKHLPIFQPTKKYRKMIWI